MVFDLFQIGVWEAFSVCGDTLGDASPLYAFFWSWGCERTSTYITNFKKIAFSLSTGQTLVSYPALEVLVVKHIHYEQMTYSDIAQKSPFHQALI